jgi:hypothetical protein
MLRAHVEQQFFPATGARGRINPEGFLLRFGNLSLGQFNRRFV